MRRALVPKSNAPTSVDESRNSVGFEAAGVGEAAASAPKPCGVHTRAVTERIARSGCRRMFRIVGGENEQRNVSSDGGRSVAWNFTLCSTGKFVPSG
jgi:hypothetical protein